jgi:hypothetical protein
VFGVTASLVCSRIPTKRHMQQNVVSSPTRIP